MFFQLRANVLPYTRLSLISYQNHIVLHSYFTLWLCRFVACKKWFSGERLWGTTLCVQMDREKLGFVVGDLSGWYGSILTLASQTCWTIQTFLTFIRVFFSYGILEIFNVGIRSDSWHSQFALKRFHRLMHGRLLTPHRRLEWRIRLQLIFRDEA